MRVVLSARGSRGDVHPVLAIARALLVRGHAVRVCVPAFFLERVRQLGLEGRGYNEDTPALMRGFGSGWPAARAALRWFRDSIEEEFAILLEETREADVLVTTAAEVPTTSVAEHRRIPHFRVGYAPILPGHHPPPLQPYQELPSLANRALWWALNRGIGALFGAQLDRWRARLGLEAAGELGRHFACHGHTLLAISRELAPPCPSWRYLHSYIGYCFDDEQDPLPSEVETFLRGWPAPVYLGFGSVHVKDPQAVAAALIDAVVRSGCRVVVGRGWAGLGQGMPLPPQILAVGELPHRVLFPWLAGAIHHGGSGTVHNAARFGLPQLALPQLGDQFYWAHRLHLLGLGPRPFRPEQLTAARLAFALRALSSDERYRQRARLLATRLAGSSGESGTAAAVERIEAAATHPRSVPVLDAPKETRKTRR